jgi:hypothetical protein
MRLVQLWSPPGDRAPAAIDVLGAGRHALRAHRWKRNYVCFCSVEEVSFLTVFLAFFFIFTFFFVVLPVGFGSLLVLGVCPKNSLSL